MRDAKTHSFGVLFYVKKARQKEQAHGKGGQVRYFTAKGGAARLAASKIKTVRL